MIQKPQKSKSRNFEFIVPNKSTNNSRSNNSSDTQSNQIAEIYGPENGMVYLLKNPRDPLLHIHLFESDSVEEVSGFFFIFIFKKKYTRDDDKKHYNCDEVKFTTI